MNRQSFLQALGLLGASAVIPIQLIETLTPRVKELTSSIIPTFKPFYLRQFDVVVFEDGSQAIITRMLNEKVELRPVLSSQDLGNGCGMAKEYDKDTLPDLVGVCASCVGEGSRNI